MVGQVLASSLPTAAIANVLRPTVPTRAIARAPTLVRFGSVIGPSGSVASGTVDWASGWIRAGAGRSWRFPCRWCRVRLRRCDGRLDPVVGSSSSTDGTLSAERQPEQAVADARQAGQQAGRGDTARTTAARPVLLYCGEHQPGPATPDRLDGWVIAFGEPHQWLHRAELAVTQTHVGEHRTFCRGPQIRLEVRGDTGRQPRQCGTGVARAPAVAGRPVPPIKVGRHPRGVPVLASGTSYCPSAQAIPW